MSIHPRARDGLAWHVCTHKAGESIWIEATDSVAGNLWHTLFTDLVGRVVELSPVLNLSQKCQHSWIEEAERTRQTLESGNTAVSLQGVGRLKRITSWQDYVAGLHGRYAMRAVVTTDFNSFEAPESHAQEATVHISSTPNRALLEEILACGGGYSLAYIGYTTANLLEPWPEALIRWNAAFVKFFWLEVGNEVLESLLRSCDVLLFTTDGHPAFATQIDGMSQRVLTIISELATEYQLRLVLRGE